MLSSPGRMRLATRKGRIQQSEVIRFSEPWMIQDERCSRAVASMRRRKMLGVMQATTDAVGADQFAMRSLLDNA